MPSDTFKRLSVLKQEALLNSAIKEFSNNSFNEASINKIIKEASISRGSFYQYFENKSDLYSYILENYKNKGFRVMKEALLENDGDMFIMMKIFLNKALDFILKDENRKFIEKVLENMTLFMEYKEKLKNKDDYKLVEEYINKSMFTLESRKYLEVFFYQALQLLNRNIFLCLNGKLTKKQAISEYSDQLDLIKYGLVRKDDVNV